MPKIKPLAQNLFVLLITLLIIFGMLEAGLRIFWLQNTEYIIFDKKIGHRLIPNYKGLSVYPFNLQKPDVETFVKINSKGYRDYVYPYKPKEGIHRIIGIGDSIVFGSGVKMQESFLKVLEKKLKDIGNFEVLNLGVMGYSLDNQFVLLKEAAEQYFPDMIIFAFFVGNDFTLQGVVDVENNVVVQKELPSPTNFFKLRRFMARNSHAYNFFLRLCNSNKWAQNFLRKQGWFSYHPHFLGIKSEEDYLIKLDKTKMIFKEVKKYAKEKNITLVILVIPVKEQIDKDLYNKNFVERCPAPIIHLTRPQKDLAEFFEEEEMITIDPLNVLREENQRQGPLYFPIDGHFTITGNQIMADFLSEKLINKGLLSKKNE